MNPEKFLSEKVIYRRTNLVFLLYEAPRVFKLIEIETRMVVAKGWGREEWGFAI